MQVVPKQVSHLWEAIQSWLHPEVPVPPENWPILAGQQPRCVFVKWLAEQVAQDILANKPRALPMETLNQSVWNGSSSAMQQRAEHFLRNHYYTYFMIDQDHYHRLLVIFRHLIQKKLRSSELH